MHGAITPSTNCADMVTTWRPLTCLVPRFQKDGHRYLNMTYGSNTRGPHMRGLKIHRDNKDANCNGRVHHKTPGYVPAIHIQQLLSLHHNIWCKLRCDDVIKHDQHYPLARPHPAPVQPEYAQQTSIRTSCEPSTIIDPERNCMLALRAVRAIRTARNALEKH